MRDRLRWSAIIAIGLACGCARLEKKPTPPSVVAPAASSGAVLESAVAPEGQARKERTFFKLVAEEFWRLELPGGREFDASGLVWDGKDLLVVADTETTLYRVVLGEGNVAPLEKKEFFTTDQLRPFLAEKHGRFDLEGITRDDAGRIYVCEEADRWVLRFDPATKRVERLAIDWSPVTQFFNPRNRNASFEGIAIGGGRLWIANERERARVIEVDLDSLKVVGDFAPQPSSWGLVLHYSDLAWRDGHLFVLLRHHKVILEIEPKSREVLAEYDYAAVEDASQHLYLKEYPTGIMEGMAVDDQYFWLVTDNNGFGRRAAPGDHRPTLFRCRRPK
jgi:uncharacterized protein YjiK